MHRSLPASAKDALGPGTQIDRGGSNPLRSSPPSGFRPGALHLGHPLPCLQRPAARALREFYHCAECVLTHGPHPAASVRSCGVYSRQRARRTDRVNDRAAHCGCLRPAFIATVHSAPTSYVANVSAICGNDFGRAARSRREAADFGGNSPLGAVPPLCSWLATRRRFPGYHHRARGASPRAAAAARRRPIQHL
jgi:hypothetical protein